MMRLTAPTTETLDSVAAAAAAASPPMPAPPVGVPLPSGLRPFDYEQTVGHGAESFEAGRQILSRWQMHRDAGVHVSPVPIEVGSDVVMWTRAVVIVLVFACRITDVVDDAHQFGFTYATLPGHPETGFETFRLELLNDVVQLHIEGASRPAMLLNKISGPIGTKLQQQVTERYITSMRSAIRAAIS